MTRKILFILFTAAVCLAPTVWANEVQESNLYLIKLSAGGPADLEAAIDTAGGSLKHNMSGFGYVSAYSEDPRYARKLSRHKGVTAVNRDFNMQWIPAAAEFQLSPLGADTVSALGHAIDPTAAILGACQWNNSQIDTSLAWDKGYYGAGIKVAVLDTGIDPIHLDLAGKVDVAQSISILSSAGICDEFAPDQATILDFNLHGSFVAGIIAAKGIVIAGVAPDAGIVGVKVLDCEGKGVFGDVIAGIIYASNLEDVDVISLSLGVHLPKNLPGLAPLLAAMTKAVNYANSRGKLVVTAAGNDSVDLQHDRNFIVVPAQSGVNLAVWAGNIDGGLVDYSNHGGNAVPVGAGGGTIGPPSVPLPGCEIGPDWQAGFVGICSSFSLFVPPCASGDLYLTGLTGTSFAAPMVAGVAALLDGKYGGALNGGDLREALKTSADDIGKPGTDNLFGHGRVNADTATDL
jgi:subtilisin family serine protease